MSACEREAKRRDKPGVRVDWNPTPSSGGDGLVCTPRSRVPAGDVMESVSPSAELGGGVGRLDINPTLGIKEMDSELRSITSSSSGVVKKVDQGGNVS